MMIKIVLYVVLLGLMVLCVCGCSWFPGVFYPKKEFDFKETDKEPRPPFRIGFASGRGRNSFQRSFGVSSYTTTPYKVIRIKEMLYEWEGNTGNFLKGKYEESGLTVHARIAQYQDGLYYNFTWGFLYFNPEKLFKGKKIGDEFTLYLKVVYSFDEGPENTHICRYNVQVRQGSYMSFARYYMR